MKVMTTYCSSRVLEIAHNWERVGYRSSLFDERAALVRFRQGAPRRRVVTDEPVRTAYLESKTETNILTAPGKPGSVDKGEKEERGLRLNISTRQKVTKLDLKVSLKIERGK